MARRSDIVASDFWFSNADKRFVFTIDAGDGTTPQDLTAWSLSWTVKRRATDDNLSALITKTTDAGGIVLTTPLSGVCTVTVTDADTQALPPGRYHHELKRVDEGLEDVVSFGLAELQRSLHKGV